MKPNNRQVMVRLHHGLPKEKKMETTDLDRLASGIKILKNYMVGDYNITTCSEPNGRKAIKFMLNPSVTLNLYNDERTKSTLYELGFLMHNLFLEEPYCVFLL